jgi:integrase
MEAGLRPSEACALMNVDIDPARRAMLLHRTYSEGKLRSKTKNQRREYWLVISDRAWQLVQRNMRTDFDFVFRNQATRRGYRYKFLYRLWKEYSGVSVDLSEATRHSFVTQLVEDGVPEDQTMYVTRHADKRSLRPYYHPTDDRTRDVLNRRGKPRKIISIEEGKKI